jgi:hypothetical protein
MHKTWHQRLSFNTYHSAKNAHVCMHVFAFTFLCVYRYRLSKHPSASTHSNMWRLPRIWGPQVPTSIGHTTMQMLCKCEHNYKLYHFHLVFTHKNNIHPIDKSQVLENNSRVKWSCKVLSLYILASIVSHKLWFGGFPNQKRPTPVTETYITLSTHCRFKIIQSNHNIAPIRNTLSLAF